MDLLKTTILPLLNVLGKNPDRPMLENVKITKTCAVATNGASMIKITHEGVENEVMLPFKPLKNIKRWLKRKDCALLSLSENTLSTDALNSGSVTIDEFRDPDYYPNTEAVLPTTSPIISFMCDADQLVNLIKAVQDFKCNKSQNSDMVLEIHENGCPQLMIKSYNKDTDQEFTALLMPLKSVDERK